jgi:DNA-binding NtrC family response regulator
VPINVRIVAATNIDLPAAITAKHFRAYLYARLAQAVFTLPPLRQRRFEVPALVRSFAREGDDPRSVTLAPALWRR